jgi:hypothetical protein
MHWLLLRRCETSDYEEDFFIVTAHRFSHRRRLLPLLPPRPLPLRQPHGTTPVALADGQPTNHDHASPVCRSRYPRVVYCYICVKVRGSKMRVKCTSTLCSGACEAEGGGVRVGRLALGT